MWEKLNDYVGIGLLVIVLGGASVYGLYKFSPPRLYCGKRATRSIRAHQLARER